MLDTTYALTASKIKTEAITSREEMLRRITRKYFQSHSPATMEDFVWWSGLTRSECRRGMEGIADELVEEKYQNYCFFIHKSCRRRGYRKGSPLLLPPFDEYLVGYKTRELVISSQHIPQAYTNNGIFFPVIAQNGRIIGNWKPWNTTPQPSSFDEKVEVEGVDKAKKGIIENSKEGFIGEEKQRDIEKSWAKFKSIMKK